MTIDPSLLAWADKIIILVLIVLQFLQARGQRAPTFPVLRLLLLPLLLLLFLSRAPSAPSQSHPSPSLLLPPRPFLPPLPAFPGSPTSTPPVSPGSATAPIPRSRPITWALSQKIIDSNKPGAALPYHFPGDPPVIRVFFRGKTVDCPIVDVGPWNTHDTYWDSGARPAAEARVCKQDQSAERTRSNEPSRSRPHTGRMGCARQDGNLDEISDTASWDFVSVLDKGNVAPSVPVPPIGPAQPAPVSGGTILQHNTWPAQSQAMSFFGNPASAGWEAANLVSVQCPWQLIVEGTKSTHNTILIHKKCAESLSRVLNYIWEQCGKSQAQIDAFGYNIFDGSYNYRPIAGTSTLLSTLIWRGNGLERCRKSAACDGLADQVQGGQSDRHCVQSGRVDLGGRLVAGIPRRNARSAIKGIGALAVTRAAAMKCSIDGVIDR